MAASTSTPAALSGLTLTTADRGLNVTWLASANADFYRVQWKSGSQAYAVGGRMATSSDTSYSIQHLAPGVVHTVKVTPYAADVPGPAAEQTGSPVGAVIVFTNPSPLTEDALAAGAAHVIVGLRGLSFPAESEVNVSVHKPSGLRITRKSFTETGQDLIVSLALRANTDFDADEELQLSITFPGWSLTTQPVSVIARVEVPPGQVTGVVVTAGVLSLDVSWNKVHDAAYYKVQWRNGTQEWGSTAGGAGQLLITATSTTIRRLHADTAYTVRVVAAKWRASDGPPSAEHTGKSHDMNLNLQAADLVANGLDEGGTKTYTMALSLAPPGDVAVAISSDQAAVVVEPARLTYDTATWSSAQTVTVKSNEDNNEENESVVLTHTPSMVGYGDIPAKTITFSVKDNDIKSLVVDTAPDVAGDQTETLHLIERSPTGKAKPYTIRLSSELTANLIVFIASSDTSAVLVAPAPLTFSSSTWNIAQTVTATAQDDVDNIDERGVRLTHVASGGNYGLVSAVVRVDVTDDKGPSVVVGTKALALREGGEGPYQVELNAQPTGPVTIAATVDGSRRLAVVPSALTFTTTNWAVARTFTVQAADDADSNDESGVVRHVARGGGYDGVVVPSVSVSVDDVDGDPALVLDSALLAVTAGSTVDYTVALATRPTGDVTVNIAATGPISVSPSALTFKVDSWSLHQTVSVPANSWWDKEVDVATLSHIATGGGYDDLGVDLLVHVLRPTTPGVLANTNALVVDEGNQTSYKLRLNTRPQDAVTVTVTASSSMVRTVTTAVTFSPEDWNRPIAVTVQAVADDDEEDELAPILHAVTGYGNITTGPVLIVTINDRPSLAALSALAVFPGELRPAFDPAIQNYAVSMAKDETHATVTAAAHAPNARVVIAPPDVSTSPGHQVALVSGRNDVVVRVLNGGQVRVYRLRIVRTTSRRPEIAAVLPPIAVEVGMSTSTDLTAGFRDPDGDPLVYSASSDAPRFATVVVSGTHARVTGRAEGGTVIRVRATDPTGLTASQTLPVAVGNVVQFKETTVTVVEGDTATLTVTMTRSKRRQTPLTLSVHHDEDPHTHDADHHDYHMHDLDLAIPAGHTSATIGFGIHDDEHIEPPVETFMVALSPEDGMPVGPARTATVTIREGICDRMLRIKNEMGSDADGGCETVSADDLARRTTLDLSLCRDCGLRVGDLDGLFNLRELSLADSDMSTLPPGIFQDLSKLRVLDMSGNRLQTLPPGLFEGISTLAEVDLGDNPGAPFTLTVGLTRQDAEPALPMPATVAARVAEGAPFPMQVRLAMRDAWTTDENDALVASASIASGQIVGTPFTVRPTMAHGAWIWPIAAPALPRSRCGDGRPCYRGLRMAAGAPLPLFKRASGDFVAPEIEDALIEDSWTLMLGSVFADHAAVDPLGYMVSSSDPSVATATIRAGMLVVDRSPGGEGPVTITITATNGANVISTLRFTMAVEFDQRPFARGWRLVLHDIASAP